MPWNGTTCEDYRRDGGRYESDVTDPEWATIVPLILQQGRLGVHVRQTRARFSTPSRMCGPRAARGGRCRATFRPMRQS